MWEYAGTTTATTATITPRTYLLIVGLTLLPITSFSFLLPPRTSSSSHTALFLSSQQVTTLGSITTTTIIQRWESPFDPNIIIESKKHCFLHCVSKKGCRNNNNNRSTTLLSATVESSSESKQTERNKSHHDQNNHVDPNETSSSSSSSPTKKTKLALEFQSMMDEFASYTDRDIIAVPNPRYRALYYGAHAGYEEPRAYRAFEILYEDMLPIRLAGRMIYRHLKDAKERAVHSRLLEEEQIRRMLVETTTGIQQMDDPYMDDGRRLFLAIQNGSSSSSSSEEGGNNHNNYVKGEYLTRNQLVESDIVSTLVELSEFHSLDDFLAQFKLEDEGRLSFVNLMIGLVEVMTLVTHNDESNNTTTTTTTTCNNMTFIVQEVELRMGRPMIQIDQARNSHGRNNDIVSLPLHKNNKKRKHREKFDDMVMAFQLWEDRVPTREGRMPDVIRGCFDGAKNPQIVHALKILYLDFSAIRVTGDLVFQIAKKLLGNGNHKR